MMFFRFFMLSRLLEQTLKELDPFLQLGVSDVARERPCKLGDHGCLFERYLSVHDLAEGVRKDAIYFF